MEKFKMIRKSNRELLLEKRITRLENMIKNEMTPQEKNAIGRAWLAQHKAGLIKSTPAPKSLESDVKEWFDDNMGPDMFDRKRDWVDDLKWMSKGAPNGSELDDCCDAVGAEDCDAVADILARLAKDALSDIAYNRAHGDNAVGIWTDPWA
jgi:hypothetical protein